MYGDEKEADAVVRFSATCCIDETESGIKEGQVRLCPLMPPARGGGAEQVLLGKQPMVVRMSVVKLEKIYKK